jgi:hypothetical protein
LKFLQDNIQLTLLEQQLGTDPTVQFHCEGIDQIAARLDIWNESNTTDENSHLLCSRALRSFADHASTKHNNKRLVKLGALMLSTGKGEIMASIFVITSNNFMTEHHDDEQEDTHFEVPASQLTSGGQRHLP